MERIRTVILGTGFMGRVHTEAIRRLGNVEVVGVVGSSEQRAKRFADQFYIEHSCADYNAFLSDPKIHCIHVCTPNSLHFEMSMAALRAGKHVLCEKPLASSVEEAYEMISLAEQMRRANCTLYNIRSYPQVQHMRRLCESGELGEILVVQGTYSQDWLLYDTDWNWRIDSGSSRTFADIGTHWCDLVEHITGLRITRLCADLQTFHRTRKRPRASVETFAGKTLHPNDYDEVEIQTEDFAAMIFQLGDKARGAMTVSQVAAGRKNRLFVEVYGSESSLAWDAEAPDELWMGRRNSPNQLIVKDPVLVKRAAAAFADLPGGHSEGYDDTFKQTFRRFYRRVSDENSAVEYPTFHDGLRQMKILAAVKKSSDTLAWVAVLP
jgi:predicted dehydrogenase